MNDSQHRINMAKWAAGAVLAMAELDPVDIVHINAEAADGITAHGPHATIYDRLRVAHREYALADGTVVRLITAVDENDLEMLPLLRTSPLRSQHTVHETWGTGNWPLSPWLAWIDQTALHDAVFGR